MTEYLLIHKLLHSCLYNCYVLFEIFFTKIRWIEEKLLSFYHKFFLNRTNQYYINEIHNGNNDIPRHLTVLLGPEEPSYGDLANIVIWSIALRIQFISFYDYKETLQKNQDKLVDEVNRRKQKHDQIIWHNLKDQTCPTNTNGFAERKIHIKILENAKTNVVDVTKSLVKQDSRKITVGSLTEAFCKDIDAFQEPELGLYIGSSLKVGKYHPWQIRLTEFVNVKTHYNITFETFLQALLVYSKCEKRLGK